VRQRTKAARHIDDARIGRAFEERKEGGYHAGRAEDICVVCESELLANGHLLELAGVVGNGGVVLKHSSGKAWYNYEMAVRTTSTSSLPKRNSTSKRAFSMLSSELMSRRMVATGEDPPGRARCERRALNS
jgi:hypothetical protein